MHAIVTIKYDFHCLKILIVLICFIIVLHRFELSTDYKQILNNLTQSFGREAALSLRW
jgi:hypothetical protein